MLDTLEAACGDRLLVGHRIDFDLPILARERRARGRVPAANPSLCTMRLAAALHPDWADIGLDAVAARLAVAVPDRHTARGDALAAARILIALLPEARQRGYRTLGELVWLQSTAMLLIAPATARRQTRDEMCQPGPARVSAFGQIARR